MTPQDIQALIDKYGPGFMNNIAAPVWQAALMQQVVVGVTNILDAIAWLVLCAFAVALSRRFFWTARRRAERVVDSEHGHYRDFDEALDRDGSLFGWYCGAWISLSVAVIVFMLGVVGSAERGIAHLINPQWYALVDLFGTVAGKK